MTSVIDIIILSAVDIIILDILSTINEIVVIIVSATDGSIFGAVHTVISSARKWIYFEFQ